MITPLGMVTQRYSTRLYLQVTGLLLLGGLAAALVLYGVIQETIPPAYGDALAAIRNLQETLAQRTFLSYLGCAGLIVLGVALLNLFYSHKIAGPLVRLTRDAEKVEQGDLGVIVRFRDSDVTTPMADAMNTLTTAYRDRIVALRSETERLLSLAEQASRGVEGDMGPDDLQEIVDQMADTMEELDRVVAGVRL